MPVCPALDIVHPGEKVGEIDAVRWIEAVFQQCELVDAIGSIQAVIELANDVETLIRAGESLPKPFVERFSKYKNDAAKMKRRLLSHARPTETSNQRD